MILGENSLGIAVAQTGKNDKKGGDNFPNYTNELNSIEEKIKGECAKVYTGEYVKLLNTPNKLPPSLVPFITNFKTEMENFRMKCVRDLRTYVS